jgi:hypothetical protein
LGTLNNSNFIQVTMVFVGPALAVNQVVYATVLFLTIFSYPYVNQYQHIANDLDTLNIDFNEMYYSNGTANPWYSPFPGPNVDTLYAWAYLDLTNTLIELHTPNTKHMELWYTITLTAASTEITSVLPGVDKSQNSKTYLLVGPNFQNGNLAVSSSYKIIKCPTNIMWLMSRVAIKDNDLTTSFDIMHQITIEALTPNADVLQLAPFDNSIYTSMDYYSMAAEILEYNGLIPSEQILKSRFATKNTDFAYPFVPPVPGTAKAEGYMAALNFTMNNFLPFGYQWGTGVVLSNNWQAPTALARWGTDYERRAYAIYVKTYSANVVEEQMYATTTRDVNGLTLNTAVNNYTLHFEANEIPKVHAKFGFITLTAYNAATLNLVDNPLNKYALNFDNLDYNNDGSLDIFISKTVPSGDLTNYLPAPDGLLFLNLRMYMAATETIYNFYLPGITIA